MGRTICFGTQSRVNGVYLLRTNLDAAFDDNGQQTNPLTVRLTGERNWDNETVKSLWLAG